MDEGRRWLAAGGLVVVAALGGCGGGTTAAPRHGVLGAGQAHGAWASTAELQWLQRLGSWNTRLANGLAQAGAIEQEPRTARLLARRDPATLAAMQRALAPATACSADFRARVGTAPTDRMQAAAAAFLRACAHLERVATLTADAVGASDQALFDRANAEATAGTRLLTRANELVPPGETRSLPVIAGRSSESRIDPRYAGVASDLAGKEVEVRCWSAEDWQKLLVEEEAYTQRTVGPDTLGFATVLGDRVNLGPDVCARLDALVYGGERPTTQDDLIADATALVTLAHEAQHARGIVAEPVAECYGIQLVPRVAAALGLGADLGERLAQAYWQTYADSAPAYRSPDCRDGGPLDLNPGTNRWP